MQTLGLIHINDMVSGWSMECTESAISAPRNTQKISRIKQNSAEFSRILAENDNYLVSVGRYIVSPEPCKLVLAILTMIMVLAKCWGHRICDIGSQKPPETHPELAELSRILAELSRKPQNLSPGPSTRERRQHCGAQGSTSIVILRGVCNACQNHPTGSHTLQEF